MLVRVYIDKKKSFRKIRSHYIVKLKIIFYDPKIPILGIEHREIPAL